jgi:membrane protease YdiL (CAAX protease family)
MPRQYLKGQPSELPFCIFLPVPLACRYCARSWISLFASTAVICCYDLKVESRNAGDKRTMKRLHITLPVALGVLAVWLALTLGGHWLTSSGGQQSLADAAGGSIGVTWALAALFALAVSLIADDRRAVGLCAPQPLMPSRLAWPPLLYALLMLFLAWASDLPPRGVVLIVACNTAFVAISEELMFRAILLRGLMERYAIWPAVLASTAIFGIVHAANGFSTGDFSAAFWQSIAAGMQGVCYAAIRLRTGSVWPMVVVHGIWDFSLMTSMLAAAADGEASALPFAALLAVLPLFLYGLYLLRGGATAPAVPQVTGR